MSEMPPNLGVTNLLRDGSDQVVRVDLVGQLGDDDRGAALGIFFDLDDAAHTNGATAGGVGVLDALSTDDEPVRRKSGPLMRSMTAARVASSSASKFSSAQ